MGYDESTIAYLPPNSSNGQTQDTYINCNDYHIINKDELMRKVDSGILEIKGSLTETSNWMFRNNKLLNFLTARICQIAR